MYLNKLHLNEIKRIAPGTNARLTEGAIEVLEDGTFYTFRDFDAVKRHYDA